jgi:hypothetical protein
MTLIPASGLNTIIQCTERAILLFHLLLFLERRAYNIRPEWPAGIINACL